jgi:hypothetical protein
MLPGLGHFVRQRCSRLQPRAYRDARILLVISPVLSSRRLCARVCALPAEFVCVLCLTPRKLWRLAWNQKPKPLLYP